MKEKLTHAGLYDAISQVLGECSLDTLVEVFKIVHADTPIEVINDEVEVEVDWEDPPDGQG